MIFELQFVGKASKRYWHATERQVILLILFAVMSVGGIEYLMPLGSL